MTLINTVWPNTTPLAELTNPKFCKLYNAIKNHNLPNFLGARIPLKNALNIQVWRNYLVHYHDKILCEFLEFGWPLGYNLNHPPTSTNDNHPSAIMHPKAIDDFINTESSYQAIEGPFTAPPFEPWFQVSPLMTKAKKGSQERRIIVDSSFPPTESVNDGMDPTSHIGINITHSLPTIADLTCQLQAHGYGAYFWKADLRRAYRQIRTDPLDSPFPGIKINDNIFVDKCPPFGCHSLASICQRMANAIVFIMAKENHKIMAYLDDFGGCHPSYQQAIEPYQRFILLASELGLELAPHKCSPPETSVDWLGYHVDSISMSVKERQGFEEDDPIYSSTALRRPLTASSYAYLIDRPSK